MEHDPDKEPYYLQPGWYLILPFWWQWGLDLVKAVTCRLVRRTLVRCDLTQERPTLSALPRLDDYRRPDYVRCEITDLEPRSLESELRRERRVHRDLRVVRSVECRYPPSKPTD